MTKQMKVSEVFLARKARNQLRNLGLEVAPGTVPRFRRGRMETDLKWVLNPRLAPERTIAQIAVIEKAIEDNKKSNGET